MLRKLLIGSVIAAVSSTVVFANAEPYVGISAGVRSVIAKDSSFRGPIANVSVGYGSYMNPSFYLAGEGFASTTVGSITDHSAPGASVKTNYDYGFDVVPGLMISDHSLAYGRVGLVRTRFNPQSATESGARLGLGLQTSLTPDVDVRSEYIYTSYRHVSETVGSPKSDQFNIGLVYKFA